MGCGDFSRDGCLFGKGDVITLENLNFVLIPNATHDKLSPRAGSMEVTQRKRMGKVASQMHTKEG